MSGESKQTMIYFPCVVLDYARSQDMCSSQKSTVIPRRAIYARLHVHRRICSVQQVSWDMEVIDIACFFPSDQKGSA